MDHVTELHRVISERGQLPSYDDLLLYVNKMGKVTIHDILTSPNRNGDTSLHISARNGHVELLKSLHLNYGLSLNSGNNEGKRPLHEAAQNGHIDCVEYMIRAGCHVDSLKRADW